MKCGMLWCGGTLCGWISGQVVQRGVVWVGLGFGTMGWDVVMLHKTCNTTTPKNTPPNPVTPHLVHHTTPTYPTLHCTALHHNTTHHNAIQHTTRHYTTPHHTSRTQNQPWVPCAPTGNTPLVCVGPRAACLAPKVAIIVMVTPSQFITDINMQVQFTTRDKLQADLTGMLYRHSFLPPDRYHVHCHPGPARVQYEL